MTGDFTKPGLVRVLDTLQPEKTQGIVKWMCMLQNNSAVYKQLLFQRTELKGNMIPNQVPISYSFSYISLLLPTSNQCSLQGPWWEVWLRRF